MMSVGTQKRPNAINVERPDITVSPLRKGGERIAATVRAVAPISYASNMTIGNLKGWCGEMIFSLGYKGKAHVDLIFEGIKTQTRRTSDRYEVGKTYAVQGKRTWPADPRGRIKITEKWVEFNSGTSTFRISTEDAKAEGGYSREEYETLYRRQYGENWTLRWAYRFIVIPAGSADAVGPCSAEQKRLWDYATFARDAPLN
jgi:hypothetical protein